MKTTGRRHFQAGFTLIEAMIALLVLTVGMLGVAAMQLKALQGAHAAYQRSVASLAAQDAQERLWAQMSENGDLACPSWADAKDLGDTSWYDTWKERLPGLVEESVDPPSGVPAPDCEFSISVKWSENRFVGEDSPVFGYTVRLPGS
ncbi:type IV pilus modification protein PilV [Halomonas sp. 11-S5]|uniref:type IV pilus modification protein PilV n=1 Tax=Halomonas sp. 11-S5 TaxID=2994064 RepID=UPI002469BC1C|nr:type IV pilus modification protein PilV [Halomonas sp. 11-S5]